MKQIMIFAFLSIFIGMKSERFTRWTGAVICITMFLNIVMAYLTFDV